MTKREQKKERMAELIKYVEEIRDENGFAVVDVDLKNGAEIYDPLSVGKNRDLSEGVYAFIDEQTNIIPANVPLKVRFHADLNEDEQEEIKKMMHRHYIMKSFDVVWDMASNFKKMLVMAAFGVAVLVAYFLISFLVNQPLFAEILSIVGSFSLWEAAGALFLERPRLRREHKNVEQNINQIIEFVK